eukprot:1418117-Pleurochrysis_carterae.AAC.1
MALNRISDIRIRIIILRLCARNTCGLVAARSGTSAGDRQIGGRVLCDCVALDNFTHLAAFGMTFNGRLTVQKTATLSTIDICHDLDIKSKDT